MTVNTVPKCCARLTENTGFLSKSSRLMLFMELILLYWESFETHGCKLQTKLPCSEDGWALCLLLDAFQSRRCKICTSHQQSRSPPLTLTCTQLYPIIFSHCEIHLSTRSYAIGREHSHGLQQNLHCSTCSHIPCCRTIGIQLVCEHSRTTFIRNNWDGEQSGYAENSG